MKLDYGKYKGIIISIALFLLLDASVLLMNFYISFEIAEDAIGVNIAGRQRMLSQRMMKSLLNIEAGINNRDHDLQQQATAELKNTVQLFNTTFTAFDVGGITQGADGNEAHLNPVTSAASVAAMRDAKTLWRPFYRQLDTLSKTDYNNDADGFGTQLSQAVAYGRQHNLDILRLMNQLTVDLESVASSKATRLRLIQTVGISLAVLNFFIIMFHFVRQLRESDEKIEEARQETQEILDTVNEGLFLLDNEQIIGAQFSEELLRIFGRQDIAGQHFSSLLKDIVSEKDLGTAKSFVRLLFDSRKKEKLIGSLNPLRQIEVHIPQEDGTFSRKYLSFAFSRVVKADTIVHVLVTVMDITKQVQLAEELENARVQGQEQLAMLSTILNGNSDLLNMFLQNSFDTFNKVNNILKHQAKSPSQYLEKANQIYALIHNFKGEAAALDLKQFVDLAHEFEEQIAALKTRDKISGNDFLSLTMQLNRLIAQAETTEGLANKVAGLKLSETVQKTAQHPHFDTSHIQALATRIAERQSKCVEVVCSGFNDHVLKPELLKQLNTIVVQMVRNSVNHGVETLVERRHAEKNIQGEINVRLVKRNNGYFQLTIEDDGRGIDMKALRTAAVKQGLITAAEAENLDGKRTAALIFHPGLSTQEEATTDAGRGIGMYSIREMVKGFGGKISINSRRGQGTGFVISFPERAQQIDVAA